jgi:hypothetical protein
MTSKGGGIQASQFGVRSGGAARFGGSRRNAGWNANWNGLSAATVPTAAAAVPRAGCKRQGEWGVENTDYKTQRTIRNVRIEGENKVHFSSFTR